VAFYIATIAYGVHRLEKSVKELEAFNAKPPKSSTTKAKAKTKSTKRKTNAKRN